MPLHPGLVGKRVVVRRTIPGELGPSGGPAMTDVLGVLESWEGDELTVRRDDGVLVSVPLDEVVVGKEVPPRPARRTR
ncbi:MAG: hypothetical protein ACRDPG_02630 [Nocardioidaceae bacterium]